MPFSSTLLIHTIFVSQKSSSKTCLSEISLKSQTVFAIQLFVANPATYRLPLFKTVCCNLFSNFLQFQSLQEREKAQFPLHSIVSLIIFTCVELEQQEPWTKGDGLLILMSLLISMCLLKSIGLSFLMGLLVLKKKRCMPIILDITNKKLKFKTLHFCYDFNRIYKRQ